MRRPQVTCCTSRNWQHSTDQSPLPPLNSSEDLIAAYPYCFEGIGCFPWMYTIHLHDDAKSVIHVPHKCPIAMCPLVYEMLDEFLEQEIIVPAKEPADWVSSLAYSWEANGKLWVCLDPKDLNAAIHHDHYHTPTPDEITHEFGGSTKLDGTSSYLCIVLDYESSLLTMFNTPWGHYRFVHLPWGLDCAQDIFQWKMDQILECCKGVIGIADDVIIHWYDEKEHDWCLHTLIQVTREHGLVFNGDLCAVKQPSIKFFSWIYDMDDAHPDPSKVAAIHNMPAPEMPSQLQKFLGLVTYLFPFVPSLSSFTVPLHGLLKKDVEFTWNETYQDASDSVKSLVYSNTTLCYFDICRPVIIQVDASKKGLGAALLQDGCPVAFASKVLTPTKQCYAIIEHELLACISVQSSSAHVFGCEFTI